MLKAPTAHTCRSSHYAHAPTHLDRAVALGFQQCADALHLTPVGSDDANLVGGHKVAPDGHQLLWVWGAHTHGAGGSGGTQLPACLPLPVCQLACLPAFARLRSLPACLPAQGWYLLA